MNSSNITNHCRFLRRSPLMSNSQNIWLIEGEAYDLSKFRHPGGPIALELGKNRDCTMLFKSYHPFTEKPKQILQKYKVKTSKLPEAQTEFDFSKSSEFWKELHDGVQKALGSQTKANFERWVQIVIMAAVVLALLPFFIMGYWFSIVAFPLAIWVFGVNTFHDACHFALSKNWRINYFFSYTAPHFSSPLTWYHQHVIGHHVYTNIHKKDPDMHHGTYIWRINPNARYYPHYKYVFYYLWIVWSLMCFALAFTIDTVFVIRGYYHRVVKSVDMTKNRKILHFCGRVLTYALIYVWPFFHPGFSWGKAIAWSIIPYSIFGICFSFSSQLNHLTQENMGKRSTDWYKHQVLTSHTFAPDSLFWFFFTGGLNLQIEHHLFPGVNHWHLRKIQPIVRAICEKHGVEYHCSKTAGEALMKHFYHLQKLSKKN